MQAVLEFLVRHGYAVVFAWVLLAQAGLPLPAIPVLLAAGALAGSGKLDVVTIVALSVLASLLSDAVWFRIGRARGAKVLGFLCKVSLEPESCVRRTEESFTRRGVATLLFAKFVPGLSTAAPPLAGMTAMRWSRFLWYDGIGALVWTLAFVVPGWLLRDQLERVAEHAALTGAWLLGIFGAIVVLWIGVKAVRRQLFLRRLRVARVHPDELAALLASPAPPFVVDLRHDEDFARDPHVVPGALRLSTRELEERHGAIPRDRDVVLYCT